MFWVLGGSSGLGASKENIMVSKKIAVGDNFRPSAQPGRGRLPEGALLVAHFCSDSPTKSAYGLLGECTY
eukprot:6480550-Amphidinium_carterae.1